MTLSRRNCLTLMGLLPVLGACGSSASRPPVPPLQAEAKPLPPISAEVLIWRPGHWTWDGRGYNWVPGQYEPRGTHSGNWQEGHWQQNGVWQPARSPTRSHLWSIRSV